MSRGCFHTLDFATHTPPFPTSSPINYSDPFPPTLCLAAEAAEAEKNILPFLHLLSRGGVKSTFEEEKSLHVFGSP